MLLDDVARNICEAYIVVHVMGCRLSHETGIQNAGRWRGEQYLIGRFRYIVSRAERRGFARNSVWAFNLLPLSRAER